MKKYLLPIIGVLIAGAAVWYFTSGTTNTEETAQLTVPVRQGEFLMNVIATGELQAKRSEKITGPSGMRTNQIYQTNITDLVPEGTMVSAGDYVATLDKTELDTKIKESLNEMDKINTKLEATRIDTAIEMRALRDELINLRFGMREKGLEVEQSKYEAPMVIQRANIELERSERDFKQLEMKYELSQEKAQTQINEIMADLRTQQLQLTRLQDLAREFVIMAPKDGMVIYARSWEGKVKAGSQIRAWDPVVAELPDLSEMVSKTYVNEVDISRVRKGQEVTIQVDAFPDNTYTGLVVQVANIGEQLRNYDSKVFEVIIQVNENDSILRPAMTTSNEVVTDVLEDKLFIPLEALYKDTLTFVYKEVDGRPVKQEVISSWTNENEVVIAQGLAPGDRVYLTAPANADQLRLTPLAVDAKESTENKLLSERDARRRIADEKEAKVPKDSQISTGDGNSGNYMIIF
ncbi:efflux RND transporter periplasmic adaptor subunit [Neolewinella persica]|uniref:efflux RND transporter periplasmic adaptor subunit n=1 Tax=Neolewinella persica TaxID=70998 RepID=UPI000370438C|nr:efflux RND transporter periplasmic adaptor subunit [Neolewinella persica]